MEFEIQNLRKDRGFHTNYNSSICWKVSSTCKKIMVYWTWKFFSGLYKRYKYSTYTYLITQLKQRYGLILLFLVLPIINATYTAIVITNPASSNSIGISQVPKTSRQYRPLMPPQQFMMQRSSNDKRFRRCAKCSLEWTGGSA